MTRVLVVDDEIGIRETLRDVFEDEGFLVDTAADGMEGLLMLQQHGPYSLLVLDLVMPKLDGTELIRHAKADARLSAIPIIVSTSHPAAAPPGILLMKKPVDVNILVNVARGLIATRPA